MTGRAILDSTRCLNTFTRGMSDYVGRSKVIYNMMRRETVKHNGYDTIYSSNSHGELLYRTCTVMLLLHRPALNINDR